tara:strand:+ start:544 stop:897 length:354 start_codon:yes stop_codon:yes gene_type:complete
MNKDKICVSGVSLRMIIGIEDWERKDKQEILVDYEFECDLSKVGESDKIEDTVDYKTVNKKILKLQEISNISTIEKLASLVCRTILENPKISKTTVTVMKMGALRWSDCVSVQITRP